MQADIAAMIGASAALSISNVGGAALNALVQKTGMTESAQVNALVKKTGATAGAAGDYTISNPTGLTANIALQFGVAVFRPERAPDLHLLIGPPLKRPRLRALGFP